MDWIKKKVSGPKQRYNKQGYDLDLTYVCPRVIGMAFPADSMIEKLYRNSITDVANLIHFRHQMNYEIYNLSGRTYDYSKFGQNKIKNYIWKDHHSPQISILFEVCLEIHKFLKQNDENVVIIHCKAGKGRTGTVICCYFLFCGIFDNPEQALSYYSKKRFEKEGYGVNQPCQIRYVYYFWKILNGENICPTVKYLKSVSLYGKPNFSNGFSPFIQVREIKNDFITFSSKKSNKLQKRFDTGDEFIINLQEDQNQLLAVHGDFEIYCYENGKSLQIKIQKGFIKDQKLFRFSFNTTFIDNTNVVHLSKQELSPTKFLLDERFPSNFSIKMEFMNFCQCQNTTPFENKCQQCSVLMLNVRDQWQIIQKIVDNHKNPTIEESKKLLFGDQPCDTDEIISSIQNFVKRPCLFQEKLKQYHNEIKEQNNFPIQLRLEKSMSDTEHLGGLVNKDKEFYQSFNNYDGVFDLIQFESSSIQMDPPEFIRENLRKISGQTNLVYNNKDQQHLLNKQQSKIL